MKRGTPGQNGWTTNQDCDPIHKDWEHTPDGDYQPKGMTYSIDFDPIVPDNPSTSHLPRRNDDYFPG